MNPGKRYHYNGSMKKSISGITLSGLVMILMVMPVFAQNSWIENTFDDFRDGTFMDGGSNLYVSARGRIQIINRWDFNNDGHLDILLCAGHGHTEKENTYIYLNANGQISGRERLDLPGGGARDGFVFDLNKDGYNDLAIANSADSHFNRVNAWIWYGSAEGFLVANRVELPAYHGKSIVGGDFNQDGWTDLAIACRWQAGSIVNPEGPEMSFIYWNSKQGFHPDKRLPLVFKNKAANMFAAADIDGDGTEDLVALTNNEVYLLLSGTGAFSDTTKWKIYSVNGNCMALGEINGDGYVDLAVGADDGIYVFNGMQDGFQMESKPVIKVHKPAAIVLSDLNRDGLDDLVVADPETPDGATWIDSYVFFSEKGILSAENKTRLPTFAASSVSCADLNKDGYPEIVFSNQRITNQQNLSSYIYWNNKGRFVFGNHSQLPTLGALANTTGDVNNDGFEDVIFFNEEGFFRDGPTLSYIYWGDGTRNYSDSRRDVLHTHHIFGQGHADLDDDGHLELILAQERFVSRIKHEQNGLIIYWGESEDFSVVSRLTMETAYGGVRIADINKDGYLDLLAGGTALDLENPERHGFPVYWGSKEGFSHQNRQIIHHDIEKMRAPLLMDLNRDDWLDIAGQVEDGRIKIWWGGETGFSDDRFSEIDLGRPDHLMYIKAADLNNDGWLDLLLPKRRPHLDHNTSFIYYGSPDGYTAENRVEIEANIPYENSIADFDNDGWLDIFMASYGTDLKGNRSSRLHWGSAEGFQKRKPTALKTFGTSGSEVLDYDGDGWLDILVANHRQAGSITEPIPHKHVTPSFLYWGGKEGFSDQSRWEVMATGPSGLNLRDPGNSYDRGLYEDYISSVFELVKGQVPASISWKAEEPFGSKVKLQLRSADTKEGLENADWSGSEGPASWYTISGSAIDKLKGRWIQYRARLMTPNAGPTPYLTEVRIDFK